MALRMTCALFGLALFWAFAPGIANSDTIDMIAQGIARNINTWHSPATSLFAGFAAPLGMPNGFLVLQVALAAVCVVYLCAWVGKALSTQDLALSIVLAIVTVYTSLLIVLASAYAIKDMWIALLLTAAGMLLYSGAALPATIAAVSLCAIAVLIRPVSILAIAPFILAAAMASTRGFTKATGAAILVLVSIAALPSIFNAAADAKIDSPTTPLFVFDIVGIGMQMPAPAQFVSERTGLSLTNEQLKKCHSSSSARPLIWGDCAAYRPPLKAEICIWGYCPATPSPTTDTWLRTISQHPLEYFKHRLAYYHEFMERVDIERNGWVARPMFQEHASNSPKRIGELTLPPEVKISFTGEGDNPILNALISVHRFLSSIGLGSPYGWTIVSLIAIAVAWTADRNLFSVAFLSVTAIAASSIANTITFMLLSAHAGPRYLCWSLVGRALAMTLALLSLARKRAALRVASPLSIA